MTAEQAKQVLQACDLRRSVGLAGLEPATERLCVGSQPSTRWCAVPSLQVRSVMTSIWWLLVLLVRRGGMTVGMTGPQ
jgi:hypothetical protein